MARIGSSGVDRISSLPDNVIDQILTCLPLIDAVRTSILSTEWKYKWTTISNLVFDFNTRTNKDFESIIYRILLVHKGSVVKCSIKNIRKKNYSAIGYWLHMLSNHGIQEFELTSMDRNTYYVVPQHLIHCKQLTCLSLQCVGITVTPAFEGFSRLVKLRLCCVSIAHEHLNTVLSKCPVLELLEVVDSQHLCLNINSPNLKSFTCVGGLRPICFQSASIEHIKLTSVSMKHHKASCLVANDLVEFFGQVLCIKKLGINQAFLECLSPASSDVPHVLPYNLNHLTRIDIGHGYLANMVVLTSLLCLIRSSPLLQCLDIGRFQYRFKEDEEPAIQYLKEQHNLGVPFCCYLKNVSFNCFHGSKPETEFVKLIFLKAAQLHKLEIRHIQNAKKVLVVKELASFPRASNAAALIIR